MASSQKSNVSSEAKIELEILKYLSKAGFFFWKNPSSGYFDGKRWRKHANPFAINGVCDILGVVGGRLVALEVKDFDGKTSQEQDAFIRKVQDCGALAAVVRSVVEVQQQFQAWGLISSTRFHVPAISK